jgi:hypothetical protein
MSTVSLHIEADSLKAEPAQQHPTGVATQTLRLYRHGQADPVALVNLLWAPGAEPKLSTDFTPPHRGPMD